MTKKQLLPVLCLILTTCFKMAWAETSAQRVIPFEEVVKKKLAVITIRSLGGYSGECIEFQIRSQAMDTLSFYIEPGRKLVC